MATYATLLSELETAVKTAVALRDETLQYLIGMAIDEATERARRRDDNPPLKYSVDRTHPEGANPPS
jgi:hypothetical protein